MGNLDEQAKSNMNELFPYELHSMDYAISNIMVINVKIVLQLLLFLEIK